MRTVHDHAYIQPELPFGEADVQEIVRRCRAVAQACGLAWMHDTVRDELERLSERRAVA